jgi:aryl-alcohol dehydrogenase
VKITAAVVRSAGYDFTLEELELDQPRDGEVLVRIHSTGICHTDITARNQDLAFPLPAVLGHEGAGTVVAVGDGVTKVEPGDSVVLTFDYCRKCPMCTQGHPAYCVELFPRNFAGMRTDGSATLSGDVHGAFFSQSSFATHALAAEANVVKVSPDVDLTVLGPLGCGVQTGAGTILNRLRPPAGSSLAVFGTGAVGLAAIMAAKISGCSTIIAVDVNADRLLLAKELGATLTVDPIQADPVAAIQKATAMGADFSIDTTAIPIVMVQAANCLAPRGTCAVLGFGPPGTEISLDLQTLLMTGRSIVGVAEGDSDPDVFIPRLIELYQRGEFPIDKLVRTYPLSAINEACRDAVSGFTIKPVLLAQ